jgi:hypothetical protein
LRIEINHHPAVVNNANAGLRWLDRQPPNIAEVQAALRRIVVMANVVVVLLSIR